MICNVIRIGSWSESDGTASHLIIVKSVVGILFRSTLNNFKIVGRTSS